MRPSVIPAKAGIHLFFHRSSIRNPLRPIAIAIMIFSIICVTPSLYAVEMEKDDSSVVADSNAYLLGSLDEFVPIEVIPEMIHSEKPKYPDSLKKSGVKGTVWVKCRLNESGAVVQVVIGKSSRVVELDKAAIDAAYKYRFKPGLQNGKPVQTWVTFRIDFGIEPKERRH